MSSANNSLYPDHSGASALSVRENRQVLADDNQDSCTELGTSGSESEFTLPGQSGVLKPPVLRRDVVVNNAFLELFNMAAKQDKTNIYEFLGTGELEMCCRNQKSPKVSRDLRVMFENSKPQSEEDARRISFLLEFLRGFSKCAPPQVMKGRTVIYFVQRRNGGGGIVRGGIFHEESNARRIPHRTVSSAKLNVLSQVCSTLLGQCS